MRSDGIAWPEPPSRVVGSIGRISTARSELPPAVRILRGRDAVLAMQRALIELSRRTGQYGAMDWLDLFIASPDSLRKTPYLLLVDSSALPATGLDASAGIAGDLAGAVFLYEYRLGCVGTRVFATDDIYGTRTVIAPAEFRLHVANLAVRQLMRANAAMVFASVDCGPGPVRELPSSDATDVRIALRTRTMPDCLQLACTLDETLAAFGATTRRNLRRYQRRAVAELGVQFVPHACPGLKEYLALNRAATHPLSTGDALWRYRLRVRSASDPATLWTGLRTAGGQWVSLIWGHRHNGTTNILSQTNLAGLPRHSLTTAMRAFLLNHEIALGTKQIRFVGGTPHPMHLCFTNSIVTDLLAIRSTSVRAKVLSRFAQHLLPDANFLSGALQDEDMVWISDAA